MWVWNEFMCIYKSFVQLQVLHVCFCIYSSTASLVRGFLSTILFRQTNNNPSLYISCTIFLQCSSVYTQFFIRDYSFFLTFTHSLPLYLSLSHTLLLSLSLTYTHSRTHTHSHTHTHTMIYQLLSSPRMVFGWETKWFSVSHLYNNNNTTISPTNQPKQPSWAHHQPNRRGAAPQPAFSLRISYLPIIDNQKKCINAFSSA